MQRYAHHRFHKRHFVFSAVSTPRPVTQKADGAALHALEHLLWGHLAGVPAPQIVVRTGGGNSQHRTQPRIPWGVQD